MNADEYQPGELEKEIENIENYHKNGTLQIGETYNRCILRYQEIIMSF